MKKYFLLIIFLLIPLSANSLVQKSKDIYITDEANILSNNTKNEIIKYSQFLKEAENIDYYVVTISDLENNDIDSYTDYIYDSFGLKSNGILIVVNKNNRKISIRVGEKLSVYIDDDQINNYIKEYFLPYFKTDNWDKGTMNGYSAIYKDICAIYNIDASEMKVDIGNIINEYESVILIIIIWICTTLSYVYCIYTKKVFIHKEHTIINDIVLGISLVTNILLLCYSYSIKPIYVLIIFIFELIAIIGIYTNSNKKRSRKKSKIKRKKR